MKKEHAKEYIVHNNFIQIMRLSSHLHPPAALVSIAGGCWHPHEVFGSIFYGPAIAAHVHGAPCCRWAALLACLASN